jgi:hypothetical protein
MASAGQLNRKSAPYRGLLLEWLVNLICPPVETLLGEKNRRMKSVRQVAAIPQSRSGYPQRRW